VRLRTNTRIKQVCGDANVVLDSTYSINIVENRFRWFGQVERNPVDSIIRRLDQIEDSHITRGIGRPRRTIRGCLFQG